MGDVWCKCKFGIPMFFQSIAVFGADGFIGRQLLVDLKIAGFHTVGFSKKIGSVHHTFDFSDPDLKSLRLRVQGVSHAIIAAAVSNIAACEWNPFLSRQVNVTGTVALAKELTSLGIRVIALSSDYVFDGKSGHYSENAKVAPLNEYGRQKAEMEKCLLDACGKNVLIIRLSKVFDIFPGSRTLLDEMVGLLSSGKPVTAAHDQYFCPTWIGDVVNTVLKLLAVQVHGLLHICSPERINRYALASQVAKALHSDEGLIRRISLNDLNEGFLRPHDTSMDCALLSTLISNRFRTLEDCIHEIISKY